MGNPQLSNATLNESGLRKALNAYSADLTTIYLESETRVVLTALADYLGPKIRLPPVHWLAGHAFGPALEIRWHLSGDQRDQFEAVALTETNVGPTEWQANAWNPMLDAETRTRDVLVPGGNSMSLPKDHLHYNAQQPGG